MDDILRTDISDLAPTPKGRVFIETWGCQMNVADSERMISSLKGYEVTAREEDADLIILNTCHIREKSTHKVRSRLGKLRPLKDANHQLKIAVTGCVAQAEGRHLIKDKLIDLVVGPGRIDEISTLVNQAKTQQQSQLAIGFKRSGNHHQHSTTDDLATSSAAPQPLDGRTAISRFVNIQQGCNNYCTFCVVPYTRGKEISRSPEDIISELKSLLSSGAKEITLLGQNVNSYGLDLVQADTASGLDRDEPFVDLLRRCSELQGLASLRFTTSNPHDFSPRLADLFAERPQVMGRYMHLPVQSGSNIVLERMRRKVTREQYFEKVDWLRAFDADFSLSTDLIVGFPGESEEDFEQTLDLVKRCQFSFVYAFKYSPRKNTAAARFKDQIEETVQDRRLAELNRIQDAITINLHQRDIGREMSVLIHYESKKEPGVFYGRSPQYRLVRVSAQRPLVGQNVDLKITDANKTALVGQLI